MTALRREKGPMANDPIERLSYAGQQAVTTWCNMFEDAVAFPGVNPSGGERIALRRAAARFLIDSGLASANGYV